MRTDVVVRSGDELLFAKHGSVYHVSPSRTVILAVSSIRETDLEITGAVGVVKMCVWSHETPAIKFTGPVEELKKLLEIDTK